MRNANIRLLVCGLDGKCRRILPEDGRLVTIGNLPGCTIFLKNEIPFLYALLIYDRDSDTCRLLVTDAIKGTLEADGQTFGINDLKRCGQAAGVESLGIWSLELPAHCAGTLHTAGVTISFELDVGEDRHSDFQHIIGCENDVSVNDSCLKPAKTR